MAFSEHLKLQIKYTLYNRTIPLHKATKQRSSPILNDIKTFQPI